MTLQDLFTQAQKECKGTNDKALKPADWLGDGRPHEALHW